MAQINRHDGKLMPFQRLVQDFLSIPPYILSMAYRRGFNQATLIVPVAALSLDACFFSNPTKSAERIVR